MSGFHQRNEAAHAHELAIIDRLHAKCWEAELFGQALLPESMRDHLKRFEDSYRHPSLLRWMPDIIAACKHTLSRSYVCLIDAKTCDGRPNYAIEISAIDSMDVFTDRLLVPSFFVFDDFKVLTARDARHRGLPGPQLGHGSGTAYLLVSRDYGRPFDEIFPKVNGGSK
jgi:hypothetical protein